MYVVRKIKGGYDYEKQYADSLGIIPGTEVEVIGLDVQNYVSYYELKGYEGQFNTVIFSGEWGDYTGGAKYQIQKIIDNLEITKTTDIMMKLFMPWPSPKKIPKNY